MVPGDIFIVVTTADGERVAIPTGTKQGEVGDKFIPVRTADGFRVPCAVGGKPGDGEKFLPVRSADGEKVAVPLSGGGGGGGVLLPYSKGELLDVTNYTWNATTGVLDIIASYELESVGDQYDLLKFVYWGSVDGLGITEPIITPGDDVLMLAPEFKSMLLTTAAGSGSLTVQHGFITAPFDPSGPLTGVSIPSFDADYDLLLTPSNGTESYETSSVLSAAPTGATVYGIIINVRVTPPPGIVIVQNLKVELFKDPDNRESPLFIGLV